MGPIQVVIFKNEHFSYTKTYFSIQNANHFHTIFATQKGSVSSQSIQGHGSLLKSVFQLKPLFVATGQGS